MKRRFLLFISTLLVFSMISSVSVSAANICRKDALNKVIEVTKSSNFKKVSNKKSYKVYKDSKSIKGKLRDSINIALKNNIIKKSKRFYPKKAIKRIELAKWVFLSMKKTGYSFVEKKFKHKFNYKDLKKGDKKVVKFLYTYGIMDGKSKTKFAPNRYVSKKEYKRIIANMKKAIKNRTKNDDIDNTSETPNPTESVNPKETASPTLTVEPTETPKPDAGHIFEQYVQNSSMEIEKGYSAINQDKVSYVRGYVGNGIRVTKGTGIKSASISKDAQGRKIDFSLDVKKINSGKGGLLVKVVAQDFSYSETIAEVSATDDNNEWVFVSKKINLPQDDKISGFVIEVSCDEGAFVLDNMEAICSSEGNYVQKAFYVKGNSKIRAQIDHGNKKVQAFLPNEEGYELEIVAKGDKEKAYDMYSFDATKVQTGYEQINSDEAVALSEDVIAETDYTITMDGKAYKLFSNKGEDTGMRNYMAYTRAQKFTNLLTTDTVKYVDLFSDGQYLGVYTMVEDVSKKKIDNLDFMVELSQKDGDISLSKYKYSIVNSGDMSAEDIKTYMKKLNDAIVNENDSGIEEYMDLYSLADWMLFNELFVNKNSTFADNCYAYKLKDGKLQFAIGDDFDLSCGNDSSIDKVGNSYYTMWNNDWCKEIYNNYIGYPQILKERWFFARWYVIKDFDAELNQLKDEAIAGNKYDKAVWGTELDGGEAYCSWLLERTEWLTGRCEGY